MTRPEDYNKFKSKFRKFEGAGCIAIGVYFFFQAQHLGNEEVMKYGFLFGAIAIAIGIYKLVTNGADGRNANNPPMDGTFMESKQKSFCHNCGERLTDGNNFCASCGERVL